MRSAGAATAWYFWRQCRWQAGLFGPYFVAVAVSAHLLPEGLYYDVLALGLAVPLLNVPLLLMPVFTYTAEGDVAGRESALPTWMFTLPVRARALAGWPMLCGTTTMAVAWLLAAEFIVRPRGIDAPWCRPALLLSAGLAWLQALFWWPYGLPGLRPLLAVSVVALLVIIPGGYNPAGLPEAVILAWLAVQIPVAYVVAVAGVARARRGETPDWRWPTATIARRVGRTQEPRKPFASAATAQRWFEWRLHGLSLPMTTGLMMPIFAAWVVINRLNPELAPGSPLRSPLLLLLLPMGAAAAFGIGLGRLVAGGKAREPSAFLATRPVPSEAFVRAKFRMAADSVLATYAVALTAVVVTVVFAGAFGELAAVWRLLAERFSYLEAAAIVLLAPVGLVAGTWVLLIQNMSLGLTGRKWVMGVTGIILCVVMWSAVPLGHWIHNHPEHHESLLAAVPWVVVAVAGVKLLLAGWMLRAVLRQGLLDGGAMTRLVGVWLAGVVCLFAVLCWLVPPDVAPWYVLACGVVLAVPLNRIGLAPLAVAWNRHR